MIVPLDEVKTALGVTGDEEDESITAMIDHAALFIEGETKRRFDEPISFTEYQRGNGSDTLFLAGHIAVPDEDASASDITVYERVYGYNDWELVDPLDYERRGDMLVRYLSTWGFGWHPTYEYKLVYDNGYKIAPIDIQKLAMELVTGEYFASTALTDDSAGLTSETLVGVYSYTVSATAATIASSVGGGIISDTGRRTINRYRKQLV